MTRKEKAMSAERNIPLYQYEGCNHSLETEDALKTVIDYLQYDEMVNSAPFYLWVVVNGIHFIIPAVILFVIGIVIGKRKKYE